MQSAGRALPKVRAFPKLYNAKRQVEVSRGLLPEQLEYYKRNPLSEAWRTQVSQDVVDFVDEVEVRDADGNLTNELLPQDKYRLFQNPSKYFSRPHNVPENTRQKSYFPDFTVTFLRTPHLGPRYAQFQVPLWFSKLDLKSYLKNLYDVDVNHIRSYVVFQNAERKIPSSRYSRGQISQRAYTKKMTAELIQPFIWPDPPTEQQLNSSDYQKKQYWDSMRAGNDAARTESEDFTSKPDQKHRTSIAEQARALLSGQAKWQPTWQQLPQDVKVLQGRSKAAAISAQQSQPPSPLR